MNTLSIEIRPAGPADSDAIADVHVNAWRGAYSGIIPHTALITMLNRRGPQWWARAIRRAASILVVEIGGEIVGYATFGRNRAHELDQQGEIYELYILPEYQGIGLGSRLFAAARDALDRHGLDGLVVWALDENDIAQSFYRGHGGQDYAEGVEIFDSKAVKKVAYIWN